MAESNKVICIPHLESAMLWKAEMNGQVSDGMWENARPYDHYVPWCGAGVRVTHERGLIGRNFWAKKDNYNFCDASLLDVVGDRCKYYLALCRANPTAARRWVENTGYQLPESWADYLRWEHSPKVFNRHLESMDRAGFTPVDFENAQRLITMGSVKHVHLIGALRELKSTVRIQLPAGVQVPDPMPLLDVAPRRPAVAIHPMYTSEV